MSLTDRPLSNYLQGSLGLATRKLQVEQMTTGKTKLDIVVSLNELITVELEKSDPVSVTHL